MCKASHPQKAYFFCMLGRCYIFFFNVLNNVPFVCNVKVCAAYEILEKTIKLRKEINHGNYNFSLLMVIKSNLFI